MSDTQPPRDHQPPEPSRVTVSVGYGRLYQVTIDGAIYDCTYRPIDSPPEGWNHSGWYVTPTPTAEHSLLIAKNLPRQRDPDDVDPHTYGTVRSQAFTEAAHHLDVFADRLTNSEDEYKAALVTRCADLVRDLIDDDGDREPRQGKPGPTPLRTVFTGSHG